VTTTIQIYGRLGRAPEQRTTAGGKTMTGFAALTLGNKGKGRVEIVS
jgi:hypothetical protein